MNFILKKIFILFTIFNYNFLFSKKIIIKNQFQPERFKNKDWLNEYAWFKINPLQDILEKKQNILYTKVISKLDFDAPEFVISPKFPHKGYFEELFILSIPQGVVQGEMGYVFINNQLPDEMARGDRFECLQNIPKIKGDNIQKVSGRVAVIAQHGADKRYANYYHWVCEVLGRLAMLEIAGIEYDWLYVAMPKRFMKETLKLWNIDFSKIIEPTDDYFCIQADELIVPSMVINTSVGHVHAGNFQHPVTLQYVREKLLQSTQLKNIDISKYPKRIFISRNDSYNSRKILNEDEIFELFTSKGFVRYELTKLSVLEQIMLFNNADIVVSEQGSGLSNIVFCKPKTKIIELHQAMIDNCFWWISYVFGLDYTPVRTLPVDIDYFADYRNRKFGYMMRACTYQTIIPLEPIKDVINKLKLENEN